MLTKTDSELQTALDDIASAKEVLEEAYTPEGSREQLAAAVGKALDILDEYEQVSDEDDKESDSDDEADDEAEGDER